MTFRAGPGRLVASAMVTAGAMSFAAGCVAPAFDSGAFRVDARAAAGSALSEVRTAALVVGARLDDRVTQPYVNTVVTGTESALAPITASFGTVDPPSVRDDALRTRVMDLLDEASTALATTRIAVRREDAAQLRRSVGELTRLGNALDQLQQELS